MPKEKFLARPSALFALLAIFLTALVPTAIQGSQIEKAVLAALEPDLARELTVLSSDHREDHGRHLDQAFAEESGEEDEFENDFYRTSSISPLADFCRLRHSISPEPPLLVTRRFLEFCSLKIDC